MILVPVKNLENAKQRLASLLDQDTRTELAQAMLHDVLDALSACCSYSEISRVTNAIFRRPAALFPLRFGNDSFKPHLAAARATGNPSVVLSLPGIALDIDKPSDLAALASAPGKTRAQHLIRQWNVSELPVAANE